MAKLYFRYGAMGSSKTANAIMVAYNYAERGQRALMAKPRLDTRDGEKLVKSRAGLSAPCCYVEELPGMDLSGYSALIVDEAQFLTKEQVEFLVQVADGLNVPVICYGLRADFQGNLFPGSQWLLAWADAIEEIKTVCWCGRKATFNARISGGRVIRTGEQIQLGGNESYVALCRAHWAAGELAPAEIREISKGREAYLPLLRLADPSDHMIGRYLAEGKLYVLFESGEAQAAALVTERQDGMEIKNLAVREEAQGRGLSRKLLAHVDRETAGKTLFVGTGRPLIPYYEKFGFRVAYVEKNFFTDNYPEEIVDAGEVLRDMWYLKKEN